MTQKLFELNPKWHSKLERFAYQNSLWIGAGVLLLGLVLDILFLPTVFQRFGAVIVGYSVLHSILVSKLQSTVSAQQQALLLLNSKSFMKDLPGHFNLEKMNDDEKSKALERLAAAIQHVAVQKRNEGLSPEELVKHAAMLIKSGIETHNANQTDTKSLKATSTNEIVLAVVGTLIWAFGDWLTNFFWHCDFQLVCSPLT